MQAYTTPGSSLKMSLGFLAAADNTGLNSKFVFLLSYAKQKALVFLPRYSVSKKYN